MKPRHYRPQLVRDRCNAGVSNPAAKLSETDVRNVRALSAGGMSLRDIAGKYDVSHITVRRAVLRITWKEVR